MICTLSNRWLTAKVDTLGAQLLSLAGLGREWIWQGDPACWTGHALTLFPFIGRQYEDAYTSGGTRYAMGIHGFAGAMDFAAAQASPSALTLTVTDDEATRACYPFSFRFSVTFALEETVLRVTYRTENRGREEMRYCVGGHPGFALPLADGIPFEAHRLVFPSGAAPEELSIVPRCMTTGEAVPFPLDNGALPLRHALFAHSARVLRNAGGSVRLCAPGTERAVTMDFPDAPVLGLWHTVGTDAPFLCVEPWSARPGRYGVVEALESRDDLTCLPPGAAREHRWSVTLH